ncbi:MAG: UDP-N-acetylmuramoyl-L-alanyl-D-glutamate--2,6-diaminopimelate ligase [Deltaproteobacteria bacterium]|nr:UDP-N-acetylmuramoyl-L-alanyl-D-glutamate--2,6-diaminopimelate ligase [Deltaproteobacteria bacterium]
MRLKELLQGLEVQAVHGELPDDQVLGLVYDSRVVKPGYVFAALTGVAADGHGYLEMAAQQGALAALVQRKMEAALPQIQVPDTRQALAQLADSYYGRPSRHMTLVGITGTNGKTTVSYLIESLLAQRGPAGLLGTVEQRYPGKRRPSAMTTPESVELQAALAEMYHAGVKGVVMEVSSHALEQHRVASCRFDAAVFTNLSRDHLDYHGDMDSYFQAKRRLFNQLLPQAKRQGKDPAAVICADDPKGSHLAGEATGLHLRTLTYGFSAAARVRGLSPQLDLSGGRCQVDWPAGSFEMSTPLVGPYNLQNALAATAVGLALDFEPEEIQRALDAVPGVPGRLQRVPGAPGDPSVFVDYAHSDQALASVLAALRPLTPGRLICVFGAGGDRDQGKRPLMGQAVGIGADLAVLTSDNPRTEDPLAIMAMVEPGLVAAGARKVNGLDSEGPAYVSEANRADAIALAIESAGPEDVVLIAGKGHEDYQIVGRERRHFDDREQAAAALARRGGKEMGHASA